MKTFFQLIDFDALICMQGARNSRKPSHHETGQDNSVIKTFRILIKIVFCCCFSFNARPRNNKRAF